ncbi:MAG: PD40 domain-containing protein [Candidatus Omnitrophica bacterium]|nr:PD40 domain-containing protein [Candidatus Omnitrophota bacterium]
MKRSNILMIFTLFVSAILLNPSWSIAGNVDLPDYPSISPDGSQIVFSWRGDLWKASSDGGRAERLTSHPAEETRSAWSLDGNWIAFESNRDGAPKIYVMNSDGTNIRLITDTDQSCALYGFSVGANGDSIVTFSSSMEGDLYRSPRPYWASQNGGALHRIHDAYGGDPHISPDGRFCLFTRGGIGWTRRFYYGSDQNDVWLYSIEDKSFEQLTNWKGKDGKARWSNNQSVYFLSDREDERVNLYHMDLSQPSHPVKQLTFFTDHDIKEFDAAANDSVAVAAVWDKLYRINLKEEKPSAVELTFTANEDESDNVVLKDIQREINEARISPDGQVMAYIAYGEVFIRNIDDKSPTQRVTYSHARERDIAWSPDGLKLYFVSDSSGSNSIYCAEVSLSRSEVKEDFESIVNPKPENEDKDDADSDDDAENDDDKNGGKKKKDLPKERQPERWHDAIQFQITPVVDEETNDGAPSPSPDGAWLAYKRALGDLMVMNLETKESRRLVEGWDFWMDWRWSPDGRYIAYHQNNMNFNSDIWIVPVDGSADPVNITRHPDNDLNPRWSADGKILSFISERINEEFDVWLVFLDRDLESYTEKELQDYFKEAVEKSKKRKPLRIDPPDDSEEDKPDKDEDKDDQKEDVEDDEEDENQGMIQPIEKLDLDDAYLRLRRVTTLSGSEGNNEMTPAGDKLIFSGSTDKEGLFVIQWDGKELKRLGDSVSVQVLTLPGDKAAFVSKGRAGLISISDGKIDYYDIEGKLQIDLQKQAVQKFDEMARTLGARFYHPTLKGLDWHQLSEDYRQLAAKTRTGAEFNRVGMYLFGELSGSHLGVYSEGYSAPNAQSMGRLGTLHQRTGDGFEILRVIPQSPADQGVMSLEPGDVIIAVDKETFSENDTLEARLRGKVGKEVLLTIRRTLPDENEHHLDVLLTPIGFGEERQLKYNDWRMRNAEKVNELSNGALGYIHIQAMNQPSLDFFERDLYAAADGKKGLIIDVRNNGGGWTTDRLLSSIMVQQHAYTIPRGADPSLKGFYPQDRLFIQRYTLPIDMLCNEKSFSNAEIISHAFKTLKRGTLVGQETNGSVISTGAFSLIDGTRVRLPFRGWYVASNNLDMENHGAVPDILIPQTPEAETENRDDQLEAAVKDLMKRIP